MFRSHGSPSFRKHRSSLIALCAASATAGLVARPTSAGTFTWTNGTGTSDWSTGGNWGGGPTPTSLPTINDPVVFPSPIPFGLIPITAMSTGEALSLTFNDNYNTVRGAIRLGPGGLISVDAGRRVAMGWSLFGDGGLTTAGGGSLTLNGGGSFTGPVTLNGGLVSIGYDDAFGAASNPLVMSLNSTVEATRDIVSSRSLSFASGSGCSLNVASGKTWTFGGAIGGGGGNSALFKGGDGTLLLAARSTASPNSQFIVIGGTLKLGVDDAVPSFCPLKLTSAGTLDLAGFNQRMASGTGNAGTVVNSAATRSTLAIVDTYDHRFDSVVTGNVGVTYQLSGNYLTLGGVGAYAGPTVISNSTTVALGVNNAIPSTSALTVNSYLDLGGYSDTVGSLEGSGTIETYGGTLTVGANNAPTAFTGSLTESGTLAKIGTGALTLNALRIGGLNVSNGRVAIATGGSFSHTSKLVTLAVTGGQFDLGDNKLNVTAGNIGSWNGTSYTGLAGLIQSGRNGGTWDGVGLATAFPDALAGRTTLGIVSGSQFVGATFGGLSFAATDVLIGYTLIGDANLDGTLNFVDLLALAQNYGITSNASWAKGDGNYDGVVNFVDLLAVAQHYNATLLAGEGQTLASSGSTAFLADWTLAQSLVPEPAAVLSLAALTALAPRRRPATR